MVWAHTTQHLALGVFIDIDSLIAVYLTLGVSLIRKGTLMALKIDPSKITSKFGLATVITLAFESLFFLWFQSATESIERIIAGVLAALVLVVFLFRVFSKDGGMLDPSAKKLIGKWTFSSTSQNGTKGTGTLNISSNLKNELIINGLLYIDGNQIGPFKSEVTRVNENRLIFYYVLRDGFESIDAVSILVFDSEEPNELNGDWIVASKKPMHGCVTYKRVNKP